MGDSEVRTEQPSGDDAPHSDSMGFDYIKSKFFRVMFADGFIVGITPTGMIHFEFFNQRSPIPTRVVHAITQDGHLGDEMKKMREGRAGIIREVEGEVILQPEIVKSLIQNLQEMVDKLESYAADSKSKGK